RPKQRSVCASTPLSSQACPELSQGESGRGEDSAARGANGLRIQYDPSPTTPEVLNSRPKPLQEVVDERCNQGLRRGSASGGGHARRPVRPRGGRRALA